jgi:hypothetical protein
VTKPKVSLSVSLSMALLILGAAPVQAQMLSTFVREQVGTLPQGRFLISFVQVMTSIDQNFDRNGVKSPLSSNFNQDVNFQRIVSEEPIRGNQLAGLFKANGISLEDSAGQVNGSLLGTVDAKVPVIGYGISDSVGLYLTIPLIRFQLQSQYQFQSSPVTEQFLKTLRSEDQNSVAREFDLALNTSLENKLHRAGYGWDPNLNRTYLGDLQLMLMKVWNTSGLNAAQDSFLLQTSFTLPTATDQNIQDLYGLRAGEGRFGFGLKAGYQRMLSSRLQWNAAAQGQVLMPTVQAQRLPSSDTDELNESLDKNTQISGGARLQAQTQLRYQFPKWIGVNVGLNWQQRLRETYAGTALAPSFYERGSAQSGELLWATYASVDLNSIQSFLDGGFMFPGIAELGVGLPIQGRNAIAEPVVQLQGSLFF